MKSKRVKIPFVTVNEGKSTPIHRIYIVESKKIIKEAMQDLIRTYKKKKII